MNRLNEGAVTRAQSGSTLGVEFWPEPTRAIALPYYALRAADFVDGEVRLSFVDQIVILSGEALEHLPGDFIRQRILSVRLSRRTERIERTEEEVEFIDKISVRCS